EAGRISFATQQNLRFLGRQAAIAAGQEWSDPFPDDPRPAPQSAGSQYAIFGDAGRPRTLLFGLLCPILSFPVLVFVLFSLWGLGSDEAPPPPPPADGGRHGYHVVLLIAGGVVLAALFAITLNWARLRRRCAPERRVPFTRNTVALQSVLVLSALGVM